MISIICRHIFSQKIINSLKAIIVQNFFCYTAPDGFFHADISNHIPMSECYVKLFYIEGKSMNIEVPKTISTIWPFFAQKLFCFHFLLEILYNERKWMSQRNIKYEGI